MFLCPGVRYMKFIKDWTAPDVRYTKFMKDWTSIWSYNGSGSFWVFGKKNYLKNPTD